MSEEACPKDDEESRRDGPDDGCFSPFEARVEHLLATAPRPVVVLDPQPAAPWLDDPDEPPF